MAEVHLGVVLRHVRHLIGAGAGGDQTDGQLLDRFQTSQDEAAFTALVERHGPLVLNVCRRVLGDAHDAEDAFQAVFLVLARKAGSIRKYESLGSWLYGVAYRIALKARTNAARRRQREREAAAMLRESSNPPALWQELRPVLDEELSRLPEKYRVPIVLRYLQGKSSAEAARELGWPEGSLAWRLSKARDLLRERLARRGVVLASSALATLLAADAMAGAVPPLLLSSTVNTALALASGKVPEAGIMSAEVIAMAEQLPNAVFTRQLRVTIVMFAAVGLCSTGMGVLAWKTWVRQPAAVEATAAAEPELVRAALTKLKLDTNWPMAGRDGTRNAVSPEKNAPISWQIETKEARAKNIKWFAKLGSRSYGNPVIAGGLVWVGTNNGHPRDRVADDAGVLMCFRESDGKYLYQYLAPTLKDRRVNDWPRQGLCGSPLVEGDRLWFCTNRCETICLDIGPLRQGTGEPRVVWRVDMIQDFGVFPRTEMIPTSGTHCSIGASYQGLIYVNTTNGIGEDFKTVAAPHAPSLICLRKDTGKLVWQDNSPRDKIRHVQWSNPLVAEIRGRGQVIMAQGDGWLRSFTATTGELIWKFDMNQKKVPVEERTYGVGTPVLHEDRVFIATGLFPEAAYDKLGRLCCIDPTRRGDISSELDDGPGKGKPNPNSGLIWQFEQSKNEKLDTMHCSVSSVAIHEGLVVAPDMNGLVHCLDARTGKKYWTYDCEEAVIGSPLIVDGKVFVISEATVHVLALAQRKLRLAKHPMNEVSFASPVYANGALYILTDVGLYAIQEQK